MGTPTSAANLESEIRELRKRIEELENQQQTALRERERWLHGQREALESSLNGAPLDVSLGILVRTATAALGKDTRAAFYLADAARRALYHVVGMPADYAEAVNGFKIGPESLACGLATHTGLPVLTGDVTKDARWQPWLWMAERFDFRGCWSFPVYTSDEKFVGTFAVYWRQPHEAAERDLELAAFVTNTASMIISQHMESDVRMRTEEALRESEKQLAADLRAMTRLHDLGTLFVREGNLKPVLDEIVDAAIAISGADFGNIQLLDPESGDLKIAAHQGYPTWWLEFWNVVSKGVGTCGTALETGKRVIVEDVERSPIFTGTPALEIQLKAEVRAVQATPLVSRSGRPLGMFSTHYKAPHCPDERALRLLDLLAQQTADIIDRAQAEAAIAGAVQRLNAHMDNSPLAVIEFDPQFRVTRWSREAERMFGWKTEEIVGRAIAEVPWVHADDIEVVAQVSRDMLEGKRPRNVGKNRNYRKDGSVVQCEWYNSAIYDSDGNLSSILSQVLDITERQESEERLRQAQKLESLGLLAGGVAHDFNNLLVGVIGNASLAQETLSPDHPAVGLMQSVIKAGEQAAHLTRQMLAYSGKGQFVVEPLDLSAVVGEISDLIRPSISKKVALRLDLEPDLPAIQADHGQVQQILMNLVINASEAIGSNDGVVTVRTGTQILDAGYQRLHPETLHLRQGEYVVLEVRDTGCGMDDSVRAKIFDPFFSTKFTGRGLGLAAVGGIVRGHKSAILVSSEPGRGSSFIVLFPPAARPAERRPAADPGAAAMGSGVVLVVDDEHVVRDMAQAALIRHGYTALVADGGMSAIDIFRRYPGKIELVILDLSMPGMSGEETLYELRKIRPEVKVLVSSGYSETEAMTTFHGQQVSGFIQKPYTYSAIAERVKLALR